MKAAEDFAIIFGGAVLLAIGAVAFVGASDALNDLQQTRANFSGLGGVIFDITDALGASDAAEYKRLLGILRLVGIGSAVFGLVFVLYGLVRALR